MTESRVRALVNTTGAIAAIGVQILLWLASYGFAARRPVGDENRYLSEALAIWQGHPPATDFIWPPLQKWFLAPLVGPVDGSLWLAQIVQTLLLVLCALLLRQIWRQLDPRPLAADIAAWLMLASPALMVFGFYLWPEPLHLFLLLAGVWLLACHSRSLIACGLAGVAIGLALLSKSLLAGFWPLLLLLLVRWPLSNSHWRAGAAFVIVLLAITGPFLWRGWQATGKPLVTDSSTYNLYVGLHDNWRSDYVHDRGGQYMRQYLDAGDTPRQRSRVFGQRVSDDVQAKGLETVLRERLSVQYFRLFNAKRTLLSQLPGPACAGYLGAYTVPAHWVSVIQFLTRAQYLLMLVLAAFGVALWKRHSRLLWLILLFFGYQLALFLGLHVKARFLLPMLPFLSGFAASALVSVLPTSASDSPSPLSARRWRVAVALAFAALLVLFACAGPWLDASCVSEHLLSPHD